MISSRCSDEVALGGETIELSTLRRELKDLLEGTNLFETSLFEVWINEDAPPANPDRDSWEECVHQAESAEIFISLYNQRAGWTIDGEGNVGICQAELQAALRTGRSKVRLVKVPSPEGYVSTPSDEIFREYVNHLSLFRGGNIATRDDLFQRVQEGVLSVISGLFRQGRLVSGKHPHDRGDALEWSRLSFVDRKQRMEGVMTSALSGTGTYRADGENHYYRLGEDEILTVLSAVPASLSVAEARELVGRPHLLDHDRTEGLQGDRIAGPVHLIGCHRNVTERQALALLGYQDAIVVKSSFGVYVVDSLHKAQLAFIENCRDETATRLAVQTFFHWLHSSDEADLLLARAKSRKKIVTAIHEEA